MTGQPQTPERPAVGEAINLVMVEYLERYARDPGSLSEDELDTVQLYLLGVALSS